MVETVQPALALNGTISLPPDKSISHRSVLFASLADGASTVHNYSSAADPESTVSCMRQLGVRIDKDDDNLVVHGVGRNGLKTPEDPLDCGNSGTTMRLLSGIVAGAGIESTLIGDESLSARTMKRIIDPLRSMGAVIEAADNEFAPIKIKPHSGIKPMRYPLPIASAQLKSCVLLAGLFGESDTEVVEQVPSRDHTERLLGLRSEPYGQGKIISSSRLDKLPTQSYTIPGDFSAAAFWMVGAAIHDESALVLENVGMNPSRTAALHILQQMGALIDITNERMQGREPVADIAIRSSELKSININPALIPNCIDELPILMVALCFADGRSSITGAEELRHKETDRLSAMYNILSAAGADVDLRPDGIIITGDPDFTPKAAEFESHHDHRMAMAAAILSSVSEEPSTILDAECTSISYPQFWTHLQRVSQ
ncbi:3-phosphoshikimate 1-carboxyvinyltransferase [Rhodohalobacter sp. 8-1]|uniref:3-phosphoshikimate 1-carboxyvinyltransferase n=1 Tax=Rhodohalobacter sp. 8-1 TaxID=3131972 RepID=UPI0030EEE572